MLPNNVQYYKKGVVQRAKVKQGIVTYDYAVGKDGKIITQNDLIQPSIAIIEDLIKKCNLPTDYKLDITYPSRTNESINVTASFEMPDENNVVIDVQIGYSVFGLHSTTGDNTYYFHDRPMRYSITKILYRGEERDDKGI